MRKFVVISSNLNDDYLFYIPIVSWAWQQLGWEVIFCSSEYNDSEKYKFVRSYLHTESTIEWNPLVFDCREETICQVSRLYVANILPNEDDLLLTSDADMLPLSDYWKPNPNDITAYGRDLSDRHYCICYISMSVKKWKEVMLLTGNFNRDIQRDLKGNENVKSDEKEKWWTFDQDLITERLNGKEIVSIERGTYTHSGYPVGRIDRSSWYRSREQKERIDCHLPKTGYNEHTFKEIIEIIKQCFGVSDAEIKWMWDYRNRYIELI